MSPVHVNINFQLTGLGFIAGAFLGAAIFAPLLQPAMADRRGGKTAGYFSGSLGFGGLVTESVGNSGIAFLMILILRPFPLQFNLPED
jgi:hypothetical protein